MTELIENFVVKVLSAQTGSSLRTPHSKIAGKREQIDCRSYADQDKGKPEHARRIPQIHLGVTTKVMERKGVVTPRLERWEAIEAERAQRRKEMEARQAAARADEIPSFGGPSCQFAAGGPLPMATHAILALGVGSGSVDALAEVTCFPLLLLPCAPLLPCHVHL